MDTKFGSEKQIIFPETVISFQFLFCKDMLKIQSNKTIIIKA